MGDKALEMIFKIYGLLIYLHTLGNNLNVIRYLMEEDFIQVH